MKTNSLKSIAWVMGVAILGMPLQPIWAQQPVGAAATPETVTPASPSSPTASAPSALVAAPTSVTPATPGTALIPPLPGPSGAMMEGMPGDSTATDPAVTALLDRLKRDSTPLSISDMSAAQDTLARLGLLLEIEKKLADVQEAHAKREMAGMSGDQDLSSSQVLNDATSQSFGHSNRKAKNTSSEMKVVTIAGASGRYSAILDVDGNQIVAKTGTVLQDGSKVTAISASGVTVRGDGRTKTLPLAPETVGMN